MLALFLALASSDATSAPRVRLPESLHQLRSLRDIPFPKSLSEASALHAEAMRRARRIERHVGHTQSRSRYAPVIPVNSATQPTNAWETVATRTTTSFADGATPGTTPITPIAYGADPTGQTDSTTAMTKAVAALLSPRGPRHTMASNITDLGGATLDLSGGTYLISAPIVIPSMYGNVQIVRGSHTL